MDSQHIQSFLSIPSALGSSRSTHHQPRACHRRLALRLASCTTVISGLDLPPRAFPIPGKLTMHLGETRCDMHRPLPSVPQSASRFPKPRQLRCHPKRSLSLTPASSQYIRLRWYLRMAVSQPLSNYQPLTYQSIEQAISADFTMSFETSVFVINRLNELSACPVHLVDAYDHHSWEHNLSHRVRRHSYSFEKVLLQAAPRERRSKPHEKCGIQCEVLFPSPEYADNGKP